VGNVGSVDSVGSVGSVGDEELDRTRRLSAARVLISVAEMLPVADPDRAAICSDLHQSLARGAGADAWALLGEAEWLGGDPESALVALRRGADDGSARALVSLERVLQATDRVDQLQDCRIRLQAGADDPEVLWARAEAALDGHSLAQDLGVDSESLAALPDWVEVAVHRAAMLGQPRAQLRLAAEQVLRGESAGLAEMRRLAGADPQAAWALGHYLWPFHLYGYLTSEPDEPSEAQRLLRTAHEQGEILATLTLWLRSDAPDEAEYEAVLDRYHLTHERRLWALRMLEGEALVGFLPAAGQEALDAGDSLAALRLLLAAVVSGDDASLQEVGRLLLDESDDGPWASFALFLQRWPHVIGPMVVGSPQTPLLARQRLPAARDDHASSVPIEGSEFASRIAEAIEQVGWRLYPLGDHLLVGTWESPAAPAVVFVEVPGTFEPGRRASISIALMAGLPSDLAAPWALLASTFEVDDERAEQLAHAVGPQFRERITEIDVPGDDYWGMQRRAMEALFRVGEFAAGPAVLPEMMPAKVHLSAMDGRRMTFDGLPEDHYPRPWISVGPSDYLVSPGIVEHPQAHRLSRPLPVLYAGYDLDARLSGGHLLDAAVRCVESLTAIGECVTGMFDRDPGIFDEFFHAIPMGRLLQHRDLLDNYLPEAARRGAARSAGPQRSNLISDYNQALALLEQGQPALARQALERTAASGLPHALARVVWMGLLDGDAAGACGAWQEHSAAIPRWIADQDPPRQLAMWAQWPNCQGNAGLALAATGDPMAADLLWRQAAVSGHAEALAFRAVLAWRQADPGRARHLAALLEPAQAQQVRKVMTEVRQQGSGWFADWAADCLLLLDGRERE